jgi:hypothetical protein
MPYAGGTVKATTTGGRPSETADGRHDGREDGRASLTAGSARPRIGAYLLYVFVQSTPSVVSGFPSTAPIAFITFS